VVIYHDGKRADLPTWLGRFRKIRMLDCGATIINMRVVGPDAAEATVATYWDAILANAKHSVKPTPLATPGIVAEDGGWWSVVMSSICVFWTGSARPLAD
jgi:hypothetical protein